MFKWLIIPLCSMGGIYYLVGYYTFESKFFASPGGKKGLAFYYQEGFDETVAIRIK